LGTARPGGVCEHCRQPARLAYHPAAGGRGGWLCPACLAALDALEGGSEARKAEADGGTNWAPAAGAWAGCAVLLCLGILWAFLGIAALLHRH
jgi:hypothetical protein